FFRAYFGKLAPRTLLVLDDLHYADVPAFRRVLAVLLRELPDDMRCLAMSRTLAPAELKELGFKGRLSVIDEGVLRFTDPEAKSLVASRWPRGAGNVDLRAARGWAAGLVMIADRASVDDSSAAPVTASGTREAQAVFSALARQMFEELAPAERA